MPVYPGAFTTSPRFTDVLTVVESGMTKDVPKSINKGNTKGYPIDISLIGLYNLKLDLQVFNYSKGR